MTMAHTKSFDHGSHQLGLIGGWFGGLEGRKWFASTLDKNQGPKSTNPNHQSGGS